MEMESVTGWGTLHAPMADYDIKMLSETVYWYNLRLNRKHASLPHCISSSIEFLYCTYSVSRTWNTAPVLFIQNLIFRPQTDLKE